MYELYANSTGGGESSGNEKKAKRNGGSGDDSASKIAYHRQMAQEFSASILDLCWDPEKVSAGNPFGAGKVLTEDPHAVMVLRL